MAIVFISGSMFGKKSKTLIDCINAVKESGDSYIAYKPVIDTRDGLFVKSRDYEITIPALPWNPVGDYKAQFVQTVKGINNVFVDEGHFIDIFDMKFLIYFCDFHEINLYIAGLYTDFLNKPFPSTKWLKDHCDSYLFFNGRCKCCGQETAVYNVRFDKNGNRITEGESIEVGDSDKYDVLCKECY